MSREMDITTLTQMILEDTGYTVELRAEETIEADTRLENLEEFLSITQAFDAEHIANGDQLEEFLAEVALFTDLDEYADEEDMVTIMTMHGAKGLEFPVVFLVGMEEGVFPHSRSLNSIDPQEIEEERRLCYVAITRAKEKLFLTRAESRMLYGRTNHNISSRFIDEIPQDIIENLNIRTLPPKNKVYSFDGTAPEAPAAAAKPADESADKNFQLGERVIHKKWGEGVIISIQGEGDSLEMKVAFPDLGIKTLVAKYAPIVKA